jgi:DNA-directed RNA polymerase subunit RPC12/RpoP
MFKMAFQFQCPQGHLLQGDEAHMGMQTQCPYCGVAFLIPVIEVHGMQGGYAPQYAGQPYAPQESYAHEATYEAPQAGVRDFLEQVAATDGSAAAAVASSGIDIHAASADPGEIGCVHIPCPNGHELETPYDMLGQEVLCPHCGAQFRLRNEDSREYQEKQARRDYERGKAWFNWAIGTAIVVGGGLLVLVAIALSK